jgi:hypothetical protein
MLDSCADIVCHGELFKEGRIELAPRFHDKMQIKSAARRDATPLEYLDQLRRQTPRKIFGFKAMPPHFGRVPRLRHILKADDWKVVILFRDPIETYASLGRAQQTAIWTLRTDQPGKTDRLEEPVRFTEETLKEFAESYNWFLQRADEVRIDKGERSFIIEYGQLGEAHVMKRLLDFLESKSNADEMTSEYRKQYSKPIHEGFQNWLELQAYLSANPVFLPLPTPSVPAVAALNRIASAR